MDLKETLKAKQAQLQSAINTANGLQQEANALLEKRQQVMQDILRLDGAVKQLQELIESEKKDEKARHNLG